MSFSRHCFVLQSKLESSHNEERHFYIKESSTASQIWSEKCNRKWVSIDLRVSCSMKDVFKEHKLWQKSMSDDSKERVHRKFNETSARIKKVVRSWIWLSVLKISRS